MPQTELLNDRCGSVSGTVAGIRVESANDIAGTTLVSIEPRDGRAYGFPLSQAETRALIGLLYASAECGKAP